MKINLLKSILDSHPGKTDPPLLEAMGIDQELVEKVLKWADSMNSYGRTATYIPELESVNPVKTAIAIGDLHGNIIKAGTGVGTKVSIQSVVKPFLYIFALRSGLPAAEISAIEATSLNFNADRVLQPDSQITRPGHPLNNAGAISSAGAIKDFSHFLAFMRELTGNPDLSANEKVFNSEMGTNSNNRAISYRLVASGRFVSHAKAEKALENYTRACAIELTPEEATRASLLLANGGIKDGKQIVDRNRIVRAINAMNSYGLYQHTAEISLMAAGVRALSSKSGVGGLIINIDPGRGAFCTYGPKLDNAGNSVFGKYALIPLNIILAAPNAMRLNSDEIIAALNEEEK